MSEPERDAYFRSNDSYSITTRNSTNGAYTSDNTAQYGRRPDGAVH